MIFLNFIPRICKKPQIPSLNRVFLLNFRNFITGVPRNFHPLFYKHAQRWAWKENIGCKTPAREDWAEFIKNCVTETRKLVPDTNFSISVKFRLQEENNSRTGEDDNVNFEKSCEKFQAAIDAGVDFITIHLRTRHERNSTPHYELGRKIIERFSAQVPVIVNGGMKTAETAIQEFANTNCAGLMVAQQILNDPDFWFREVDLVGESIEEKKLRRKRLIQEFVELAVVGRLALIVLISHICSMLEPPYFSPKERDELTSVKSFAKMTDYLKSKNYL